MVQYVSYASILSNAFGASAFHSVSNGAVSVVCAGVNNRCIDTGSDGSEKAVETLHATCCSIIAKLKARESRFDALIQELRAFRSLPTQPHDISHHATQLHPHDNPPNTAKQNSVTLHIATQPPEHPATPTPPSTTQPIMDPPRTKDAQASASLHAAADSAAVFSPFISAAMASQNPHDEVPFSALSAASNGQPPQQHEVPFLGEMISEYLIALKVLDASEAKSLGTVPVLAPSSPPLPSPPVLIFSSPSHVFPQFQVNPSANELRFSYALFGA